MVYLHIFLRSLGLVLASALVVVGYFVAPVAFSSLDQVTAGNLVGQLLMGLNIAILVTLLSLLIIKIGRIEDFVHNWLLLISVIITCLVEFWISPRMQVIKGAYPSGLTKLAPEWTAFAMWHGIYQMLFLSLIICLFIWSVKNINHMILKEKIDYKKSL